jgi:3-oxoacyl-[acyl-carrier-protein] synthase II
MTASTRRAVITGIGVLSPIGLDAASFWQSLQAGKSGIRSISIFDASGLPSRIAGEIPDFDAKKFVDKKDRRALKMMARTIELAVSAAQLALNDGKVDKSKLNPERFGVEFGASLIASELPELADAARISSNCQPGAVDLEKWGEQGLPAIQPLWMLKYLPNMLACHVSILHDARGPNNSITESDVAGLLAMGEAYRILLRDQADFFLVGAAESKINPLSMVRQCLIGEGGCVFVLEDLAHAQARGAHILAEMVGFGAAFDVKKNGDGVARAVRAALKEAGIGPEQVDHINAHGLAAKDADVSEARGLQQVFGAVKPAVPVFAPKSYVGNLGAGGGTMELAASVLALQHGLIPVTLNYEHPDPACPLAVTRGEPRPVQRPYVVKVSFTQMGQCAALVLRKW